MPGKLSESKIKATESTISKDETKKPNTAYKDEDYELFQNPEKCMKYIQELRDELNKEQIEKEVMCLERDKIKVCWEMTMEQLSEIKEDLMSKIEYLQKELTKQVKRKRILQKLLQEHGRTIEELKELAELFFVKNSSVTAKG